MDDRLLIFLNLIVCSAGGFICICRLNLMKPNVTKPSIRTQYVGWFTVLAASAISWTYDAPATITQIALSGMIVAYLMLGRPAWARGAPDYTRRLT